MAAAKTNPSSFYFITLHLFCYLLFRHFTNRWNIKINFNPITISFNEVIKCPPVSKSPMTQAAHKTCLDL